MSEATRYAVLVLPDRWGWTVTCSCGYRVPNVPKQSLAQSFMDNHVSRAHQREDDSPSQEKGN
jgi:hypothetical protein